MMMTLLRSKRLRFAFWVGLFMTVVVKVVLYSPLFSFFADLGNIGFFVFALNMIPWLLSGQLRDLDGGAAASAGFFLYPLTFLFWFAFASIAYPVPRLLIMLLGRFRHRSDGASKRGDGDVG